MLFDRLQHSALTSPSYQVNPQCVHVCSCVCSLYTHVDACSCLRQAKKDLGYSPLWSVAQGLHLTLRSFSNLRNPDEATPYMNSQDEVRNATQRCFVWMWVDVGTYEHGRACMWVYATSVTSVTCSSHSRTLCLALQPRLLPQPRLQRVSISKWRARLAVDCLRIVTLNPLYVCVCVCV